MCNAIYLFIKVLTNSKKPQFVNIEKLPINLLNKKRLTKLYNISLSHKKLKCKELRYLEIYKIKYVCILQFS
jgi:hypothetical protein